MIIEKNKEFEKPNNGRFNGTIIDVVDLGLVKGGQYGDKVQLRIIWVLGTIGGKGAFAVDSEGNPFRAMKQVNATIDEKSKLTELVKSVTGAAPAAPFDSEVLMGRSNQLFIEVETAKSGKSYPNIKFITAMDPGEIAPGVPQGFVRAKDRPAKSYPQSAAPAVAQPPAQPITTNAVAAPAPVQANPAPAAPVATAAPQPAVATAPDAAF